MVRSPASSKNKIKITNETSNKSTSIRDSIFIAREPIP
jgi:hypothetical protein